jgi:hypothetical protein
MEAFRNFLTVNDVVRELISTCQLSIVAGSRLKVKVGMTLRRVMGARVQLRC